MNIEEAFEIVSNLILFPMDWKVKENYKGKLQYIGSLEGNEAIDTIIKEYKKKDKIIDKMSKYIGKEDTSEEFCYTRIKSISDCDENCELCVKQYFKERCK